MTNRNLLIKFNRFSINEVLAEWEKADKSKEVIVLESATSDWSIEVDGIQNISHQAFETFFLNWSNLIMRCSFFVKKLMKKVITE